MLGVAVGFSFAVFLFCSFHRSAVPKDPDIAIWVAVGFVCLLVSFVITATVFNQRGTLGKIIDGKLPGFEEYTVARNSRG